MNTKALVTPSPASAKYWSVLKDLSFSRILLFQSTPLREGRRLPWNDTQRRQMFQATPLREGRPTTACGGDG